MSLELNAYDDTIWFIFIYLKLTAMITFSDEWLETDMFIKIPQYTFCILYIHDRIKIKI